jgi:hypothetical protein
VYIYIYKYTYKFIYVNVITRLIIIIYVVRPTHLFGIRAGNVFYTKLKFALYYASHHII